MINTFNFCKDATLLNKKEAESLLNRFDQIYKENMHKSLTSGIRELIGDEISNEPLFTSLLERIHKKFEFILDKNDLSFEKLWLVSSIPSDADETKLPYIPHIDKDRSLKAMIYLHDVSLDHGPIHIGRAKNNIDTEQIRKQLPHDYQLKNLNTIKNENIDGSLTPMTGEAGDVIFFDTNTPHQAGILKDGYYRKVLRFKFKRPSFNPRPFILNRIINRIKKAI